MQLETIHSKTKSRSNRPLLVGSDEGVVGIICRVDGEHGDDIMPRVFGELDEYFRRWNE